MIPSQFLEAGKSYTFNVEGRDGSNSATAAATVQVLFGPLQATISGGDKTVSVSDAVEVAVVAVDNDDQAEPFTFKWTVTPDLPKAAKKHLYTDKARGSGIVEIPANALPAGTYAFAAEVKKEGRTAVTAMSVLTVKEEEVVNLFLSTLGTAGVLENLDPMVPFALVCEEFAPLASAIDFVWKSCLYAPCSIKPYLILCEQMMFFQHA